jgi:hypothetical protein
MPSAKKSRTKSGWRAVSMGGVTGRQIVLLNHVTMLKGKFGFRLKCLPGLGWLEIRSFVRQMLGVKIRGV